MSDLQSKVPSATGDRSDHPNLLPMTEPCTFADPQVWCHGEPPPGHPQPLSSCPDAALLPPAGGGGFRSGAFLLQVAPEHLSTEKYCGSWFPASHWQLPPSSPSSFQPSTYRPHTQCRRQDEWDSCTFSRVEMPWPSLLSCYKKMSAGYTIVHLKMVKSR